MAILVQSNKKPNLTFPALTGDIVTFNSQYAGLPLKTHKIALTATQSGSGTPSPDNVRPISGHNTINISHSGADTSSPTTHIITIGSTVYGGEYDARTGLLMVTHGIVDLSTLNWIYQASSQRFRTMDLIDVILPPINRKGCFCSHLDTVSFTAMDTTPYSISSLATTKAIFVNAPDYTSVADFLEAFSGATLVYPLATPQTIQLPPCPIETLQGVNNIWASTGETTVEYIKIGG